MIEWLLAAAFISARSADSELKSKLDQEDADEVANEAAQLASSKS